MTDRLDGRETFVAPSGVKFYYRPDVADDVLLDGAQEEVKDGYRVITLSREDVMAFGQHMKTVKAAAGRGW